jgi:hypothetical protein
MINRPYPWSVVRTVKNHNVQPYYDKGSSVLVNVSTGSQLLLSRPAALAASTLHKAADHRSKRLLAVLDVGLPAEGRITDHTDFQGRT